MARLIGFSGAHRVGKTTLAKIVAERYGGEFVRTNVSSMLAELNVNAISLQHEPLDRFLYIQDSVLACLSTLIDDLKFRPDNEVYVLDRTPVDVLGYTRAYLNSKAFEQMETLDKMVFNRHQIRAHNSLLRFDHIVHIQPGIRVVDEAGKALPDLIYMDQLNKLMLGELAYSTLKGLSSSPKYIYLPQHIINLEERVRWLSEQLDSHYQNTELNHV